MGQICCINSTICGGWMETVYEDKMCQTERASLTAYFFLVIFDGEFQSRQVVVALLVQQVDVVPVVEDHFQLSGAPRLVQEVLGKLFALLRQLLILGFELILHLIRAEHDASSGRLKDVLMCTI